MPMLELGQEMLHNLEKEENIRIEDNLKNRGDLKNKDNLKIRNIKNKDKLNKVGLSWGSTRLMRLAWN